MILNIDIVEKLQVWVMIGSRAAPSKRTFCNDRNVFYPPSNTVPSGVLITGNGITKEIKYKLYLILINFELKAT